MPALHTNDLPFELRQKPRLHRNVMYVCMAPASWASEETLKIRQDIFKPGNLRLRCSSHWPQYMTLFSSRENPNVPEMPMPNLSERGKQLAGLIFSDCTK